MSTKTENNKLVVVRPETSLDEFDLRTEAWREYDFGGRTYRIDNPLKLFIRRGSGTTHRILDKNNVVHCVPTVGQNGCVLRWQNKDKNQPCEF